MANPEHLAKLREGVKEWNEWRRTNPEVRPDLAEADLRGLDLTEANLTKTWLGSSKLGSVNLHRADLSDADLTGSNLANATITYAVGKKTNLNRSELSLACLDGSCFDGATFRFTFLEGTHLWGTSLIGADLSGSHLNGTVFRYLNLTGADFQNAILDATIFDGVDVSEATNIDLVDHQGSSSVSPDCFIATAQGINGDPSRRGHVEQFLRAAGVPESFMQLLPPLIANPIEYFSCFISYSHADKAFARRLYDTLQGRGIRCWLDEHELVPGDHIHDRIDEGIRLWDKVLLLCSEKALSSWWVDREVNKALAKEERLWKERQKRVLAIVPLNLDGSLFEWQGTHATTLRERVAPDFTGWDKGNAKFEAASECVVKALRSDDWRPKPPDPKL